jgi:hypothetical protein
MAPLPLFSGRAPKRRRRRAGVDWLHWLPVAALLLVIGGWRATAVAQKRAAEAGGAGLYDSLDRLWMGRQEKAECRARLADAGVRWPGEEGGEAEAAAGAHTAARQRLYTGLQASLRAGALEAQLENSATQGLRLAELFRWEGGEVRPVLSEPLEVSVRAVVLPLSDAEASRKLRASLERHLLPLLPAGSAWHHPPELLHSTVFHASSHRDPVRASSADVDAEVAAVQSVAGRSCPIHAVLERIAVTGSGTVLACWQVAGGAEPAELRARLRAALPRAPAAQVVADADILHTTLARLVPPPGRRDAGGARRGGALAEGEIGRVDAEALRAAAAAMTAELCGTRTLMQSLWFVEEEQVLALALGGRLVKRPVPMRCLGE